MSKRKIILVAGRTCSGKSSIVSGVCNRLNLVQVKSFAARQPREEEKLGKTDHYFINAEDVDAYKDDMAAWTEINGNQYFTTKTTLRESDIYVIDPVGIYDLKERCGDEFDFVVIYVRTPKDLGVQRAKKRGDKDVFIERYDSENSQFTEFEKAMSWDYHILNNRSLDEAVATMEKMIRKELVL